MVNAMPCSIPICTSDKRSVALSGCTRMLTICRSTYEKTKHRKKTNTTYALRCADNSIGAFSGIVERTGTRAIVLSPSLSWYRARLRPLRVARRERDAIARLHPRERADADDHPIRFESKHLRRLPRSMRIA